MLKLIKETTGESDKPTRIAAVLSDGSRLYALRYSSDTNSPSLYYGNHLDGGVVVASEPIDNDSEKWNPVGESSLIIADHSNVASHSIVV